MSLTGASNESQINLNGTNFFWDRGYGGVEGEVNSFALEKGAVLVGTPRRMKSFSFTFDQQPGSARRLVREKGSMASYWAVKTTSGRQQYALAHRNGLGSQQHQTTKRRDRIFFLIRSGVHTSQIGISL
jgi:hypothetical protein